MDFRITGRIVPYVRMTRRGKWVNERAQAYLASQEAIRIQLRLQMAEHGWEMLPEKTPLRLATTIWVRERLHTSDCDNIVKALADAAQTVVYANDCWIDYVWANRFLQASLTEDFATLTVTAL